jgi:hypothetical protein
MKASMLALSRWPANRIRGPVILSARLELYPPNVRMSTCKTRKSLAARQLHEFAARQRAHIHPVRPASFDRSNQEMLYENQRIVRLKEVGSGTEESSKKSQCKGGSPEWKTSCGMRTLQIRVGASSGARASGDFVD